MAITGLAPGTKFGLSPAPAHFLDDDPGRR